MGLFEKRNRSAWAATGSVLLTVFYMALKWGHGSAAGTLVSLGILGLPTTVGLTIGWRQMYRWRKESHDRRKPLDLN